MPAIAPTQKAVTGIPTIGLKNAPRTKDLSEQEVTVWSPEGEPHKCPRHQANDLVRHNGWKAYPPKGAEPEAEVTPEAAVGEADAAGEAPKTSVKEPDELDVLRATLKDKGIEFDARWGKKKLQEALDAAK